MKKGKKIILCSLLVLFICLGNVYSAMFVTDLLQIINTIKSEVQNALQRVQERIQWSQEIQNMNDTWAQIQTYYKELEGLSLDDLESYRKAGENVVKISEEVDKIATQCDEIIEKSNENVEDMYEIADEYDDKQNEVDEAYYNAMKQNPLKTYDDILEINKTRAEAIGEIKIEVSEGVRTINKQITEQFKFYQEACRAIAEANNALKDINDKINDESNRIETDISSNKASEKKTQQRQVMLTLLIAKRDALESKIALAKEKKDDIYDSIKELYEARDEIWKREKQAKEKSESSKQVVDNMSKKQAEKNKKESEK